MNNNLNLTSLKDALNDIEQSLSPITATENIKISTAVDRVLADDVISRINVPAHTNSAMDGFALREVELKQNNVFKLAGVVHAGEVFVNDIAKFACVRIMTGAPIPEGLDFVVPQEFVTSDGNRIEIINYKGGANVRMAGEDLAIGEVALHKGRRINANDVGLLASLGQAEVKVYRKLKVAFFSTGNELVEPGSEQSSGQIYDSNRYAIKAMLESIGVKPLDLGIIKDDPGMIKTAFVKACENSDVVLTSGGVSVGDADYVKQVLAEIGQIDLWRLSIKPGKPLAYGKIDKAYFFGLPGNPVSAAIVFYKIVAPMLKILMGQKQNIYPPRFKAKLANEIKKKSNRMEFMRAVLSEGANGLEVEVPANQGSGILSSMYKANCLVVLDESCNDLDSGAMVEVEPFYGLV